MLDERIPLVARRDRPGDAGPGRLLHGPALDQGHAGGARRRRGRLPGRADLQLHEPRQHRRPGGHRPLRRPVRVAVRGPDRVPGGARRGRGARPGAARRRERRPQPRLVERAPPLRRAGPAAAAQGGVGAPRRRPATCGPQTRRMLRLAAVDGRAAERVLPVLLLRGRGARRAARRSRRRAPRTSSSWVPGYWDHYVEQAGSDSPELDPGRSRGGIHELELAIDCMDAVFNDRGETLPVNVPNQGSVPGLPGHAGGRDARRAATPAGSTRSRCRGCRPTCAGWSRRSASTSRPRPTRPGRATRATRVRALAAHPLVRSIDLAERLYAEMADAHRAHLPARLLPLNVNRLPGREATGSAAARSFARVTTDEQ